MIRERIMGTAGFAGALLSQRRHQYLFHRGHSPRPNQVN
jgi:hypothetical protein